ncbi:hypothetical protein BSL78_17794 [Apostichopus japonicus]|uniref:Uncharacterized protein n=1 Tax=Stichopus japonicus TaxID=307972 RepID=A0A2G8KBJ3_STIJA|nr:hypothetical protein BSL78_17794 [Apostichopus japonicus]
MLSILDASARSWATHGRTRSPTTIFCARLGQRQFMQCSVNVGYAGLDTSPDGQRTHLQGPTVWSVGVWHKIHRSPTAQIQGLVQKDLLSAHMDMNTWEGIVVDRPSWRHEVKQGIDIAEQDRREQQDLRRQRRKESSCSSKEDTIHVCTKDCHSRIGIPPAIERVSGLSSNQDTLKKAAPTYNHGLRSAGYNCTMK